MLASLNSIGGNKIESVKLKVTDNQGEPIIGAKIILGDSKDVLYTDFEGDIVLKRSLKEPCEVSISMVSFESRKIKLPSSISQPIVLELRSK